ncbi:MAG TPA: ADP-ribosylglycohydrolase family protein [Burkholderiales bacterium]|nr:ADP-ribosylglycohydrolase family protein [Burkholderiales bacterium]
MSTILLWALSALLAAVFVAANVSNLRLLLGHYRRADGSNPSPIPFAGGIAGALALWIAPNETLGLFFWVPLVVDLGTGPFLLLLIVVSAIEGIRTGAWWRRIPFVRYVVKPEPVPARQPFPKEPAITGCILGTAVADAMGLACEGLSRARQARMFPELTGYKLLPFGKGLCSDDTEHTCMLAQSLIETAGCCDADDMARRFASNFGWRLRFWVLGMPAGIGFATLRAIFKLWIGFPARYSGVFSAGNGPAMRVALIGVCYGDDPPHLRALVRAATRITPTDPKAEHGALAVALAAHLSATGKDIAPAGYLLRLRELLGSEASELPGLVENVAHSVARNESTAEFAAGAGCGQGVSGYILHTVPAALHAWLTHQGDYRGAVTAVVRLGGDSDTAAAIVGAVAGARTGKEGIPAEWLRDLWEWPRTVAWMERLAARLAEHCEQHASGGAVPLGWLQLLLRNVLFIPLVLAHGFRRLLPPY